MQLTAREWFEVYSTVCISQTKFLVPRKLTRAQIYHIISTSHRSVHSVFEPQRACPQDICRRKREKCKFSIVLYNLLVHCALASLIVLAPFVEGQVCDVLFKVWRTAGLAFDQTGLSCCVSGESLTVVCSVPRAGSASPALPTIAGGTHQAKCRN